MTVSVKVEIDTEALVTGHFECKSLCHALELAFKKLPACRPFYPDCRFYSPARQWWEFCDFFVLH